MKRMIIAVLAVTCVIGMLSIAGRADYEDAVQSQRRYCAMVSDGLWPDYLGTYKETCQ